MKKTLMIFGVSTMIAGFGLILWADWRIALGTFLIIWSMRLEDMYDKLI